MSFDLHQRLAAFHVVNLTRARAAARCRRRGFIRLGGHSHGGAFDRVGFDQHQAATDQRFADVGRCRSSRCKLGNRFGLPFGNSGLRLFGMRLFHGLNRRGSGLNKLDNRFSSPLGNRELLWFSMELLHGLNDRLLRRFA